MSIEASVAQDRNFKLTGSFILTNAALQQGPSAPNFEEGSFKGSFQIGMLYDHYFSDNNFGYRAGFQIGTQRYGVDFYILQSYRDFNGSNAELTVWLQTVPGYIVARLPLALLYKKLLHNSKSFINFSTGISLDWYFLDVVVSEYDLLLKNPQAIPQWFHVSATDNYEFKSSISFSVHLGSSFNFLVSKRRYMEIGINYFYSPVNFDPLKLVHTVNHDDFEANYRIKRMDNIQITIGYFLNKITR